MFSPWVTCWKTILSQYFLPRYKLCMCAFPPPSTVIMRGGYTLHLPCGVPREKMWRREDGVGESWEFRARGELGWTGGEGVKCAGLILLSQQQYVIVQGFIVADTEWNSFPLVTLVTEKALRKCLTLTAPLTNHSTNTGKALVIGQWLLCLCVNSYAQL